MVICPLYFNFPDLPLRSIVTDVCTCSFVLFLSWEAPWDGQVYLELLSFRLSPAVLDRVTVTM